MKRCGNLIPMIAKVPNLYHAYYKASKGKRFQEAVVKYSKHLDSNIYLLQNQIINGEVEVGEYEYFTISDPKVRKICAASFPERVLHHAIMNVCHQIFDKHLIFDSYATREDKGIYKALEKVRRAFLSYQYVAKLDVQKYFDSVDHEVLIDKLSKMFKDARLIRIFRKIINSYHTTAGHGIPIGNLTSQYFANQYLSSADYFAKGNLRIPVYVRYMDDILLFGNDKSDLKAKVACFTSYVKQDLMLQFKPAVIKQVDQGISFCGYRVKPHKLLLSNRSKTRFKRKLTDYGGKLADMTWSEQEYQSHVIPLLAFARHAYTKKMRMNIINQHPEWDVNFSETNLKY